MAIKALKIGAFEFIEKPFDQERLINFVSLDDGAKIEIMFIK